MGKSPWIKIFELRAKNPGVKILSTLYDIPPMLSAFQVTQTDPRSSLMMADHCRNMLNKGVVQFSA
jgi:hypothetical protein